VLLSGEEKTLYVAENVGVQASVRELRAYRLAEDGSAGSYVVLHAFGTDHRGPHRGIEGMCLDEEGNIVATAGSLSSGPGPVVMVLATTGRVHQSHDFTADRPPRCVFGGRDLATLYVGTDGGEVYRAEGLGRRGFRRW
jgi:gluconolactonase